MSSTLEGKVALIVGDGGAACAALASGLEDAGAKVGMVGPSDAKLDDRAAVEAAIERIATRLGPIDLAVLPVTDPAKLAPVVFAELSESEWMQLCEVPLKAVRVAMQAAHKTMKDRGGRLLLLVPTIAITGADGLAPYSAVAEGARSLSKAAARKWGEVGITVNCLALTPEQLHPEAQRPPAETRTPNALGHVPDLRTEIAPFIATFVAAPGIVTGTTLMVDGGNLMSI